MSPDPKVSLYLHIAIPINDSTCLQMIYFFAINPYVLRMLNIREHLFLQSRSFSLDTFISE